MNEDDLLMDRLQRGDPRAFGELVERHQHSLIGFFFKQTRDIQLAEDLTQETFLRVHDQFWNYLPRGQFRGWMFRIARNLLIDSVRRRKGDALLHTVRHGGDDESEMARVTSEILSPEELANISDVARLVDRCLGEIPEDQRLTFVLHHYQNLTLPEVADAMEANLPTTKSRLRLAKEKLRERLIEHGVVEPPESRKPSKSASSP